MPPQSTPPAPAPADAAPCAKPAKPAAIKRRRKRPTPRSLSATLDAITGGVRPLPYTEWPEAKRPPPRPTRASGERFMRQKVMLDPLRAAFSETGEIIVQRNGDLALRILTECVGPDECEVYLYAVPWREAYTLAPGYRDHIFPPRLEALQSRGNTGEELLSILLKFNPTAFADRWLAWDDPNYARCDESSSSEDEDDRPDSEDEKFVAAGDEPEEPEEASDDEEEASDDEEEASDDEEEKDEASPTEESSEDVPLDEDSDEVGGAPPEESDSEDGEGGESEEVGIPPGMAPAPPAETQAD